jgi:lipoprotein-anchoring transpeptidase ErfK/SrfK
VHVVFALSVVVGAVVALDPAAFGPGTASVSAPLATPPSQLPTVDVPPFEVPPPSDTAAQIGSPATDPPVTAPPAAAAPPATDPPALVPTVPTVAAPSVAVAPIVVARVAVAHILVFPTEGSAAASFSLSATTEFGTPRVLLTVQLRGDWVQVLLPTPPNGSTGWVRAADVTFDTVPDRLVVDRAARTLTWTSAGQPIMTVPVAVGAASSPTPAGTFFVTDVLPEDPAGPYGSWALALNGRPDGYVPTATSDLRIAIHGTNAPSSIGAATSNGCVRVDAAPLAQLAARVEPGTPVVIR